jgi:hypothetical protein
MIRRIIHFSYRDNPAFKTFFGDWKYYIKNTACFEVIMEDGNKSSYAYAVSAEEGIDSNEPRFDIKIQKNELVEEEEFLKIINHFKNDGFYAQEKYISLFLNGKIDKLLLNRHKNNKLKR